MALNKKSLIVPIALAVVATAGVVGVGSAQAASQDGGSLVDKLAKRFNLNKTDVQKVFDENHASREAEHQKRLEQRLQAAVDDKKITSEQRDQILAKLKDLQSFRDSLKDKTPQQRHDSMRLKMDELKKWADDNNIPRGLLRPAMGRHGHRELPETED